MSHSEEVAALRRVCCRCHTRKLKKCYINIVKVYWFLVKTRMRKWKNEKKVEHTERSAAVQRPILVGARDTLSFIALKVEFCRRVRQRDCRLTADWLTARRAEWLLPSLKGVRRLSTVLWGLFLGVPSTSRSASFLHSSFSLLSAWNIIITINKRCS